MIRRTVHTAYEPRVDTLTAFAPDLVQAEEVEHDGAAGVEVKRPDLAAILFADYDTPGVQEAHVYPLAVETHYGLAVALAKRLPDAQRLELISALTGGIQLPGGQIH